MLPPELQSFSRLPFWSGLFFLLAVAILLYSVWSLGRRRHRQDLYYLLLGAYLMAVQLPEVIPSVAQGLHLSFSSLGFTPRLFVALPAVVLFVMGVRSR
ncbi:MAG: hypothetical protein M1380_00625 [Chloroflexi bacterium]|nr:hypothetical protein [Chloroflexota bacterium]